MPVYRGSLGRQTLWFPGRTCRANHRIVPPGKGRNTQEPCRDCLPAGLDVGVGYPTPACPAIRLTAQRSMPLPRQNAREPTVAGTALCLSCFLSHHVRVGTRNGARAVTITLSGAACRRPLERLVGWFQSLIVPPSVLSSLYIARIFWPDASTSPAGLPMCMTPIGPKSFAEQC